MMGIGAVVLLGTPIDDVTMSEALDRIEAMIATGRTIGRVHQIATVNVDFLVNAAHDPSVLDIMQRTDLAIPDGMGVVWGARLTGVPIRERTSGADLVPALAERAARSGWRLCLFGAAPGVADAAAEMLRDTYVGADVVALAAPDVAADGSMNAAALVALRAIDADVVAVALGNPKQERWIARHGTALGAPVCIGIGGSLDFLTGVTRRAPAWMQRWGLEWIHRAMSEPRRLAGRYAKDLVVYLPAIAGQAWRGRRRSALILPASVEAGTLALRGPTRPTDWPAGDVFRIDLAGLDRLDNATLAAIVSVRRRARARGETVEVTGASAIERDAERLGCAGLLR
jgi:N-acetylglucosaminyldiphosphoundecaprenol N-acetyl-beta-D-mannosaminyltransferase